MSVRSWLPPQALDDGVLDAIVTASANAWGERWFAEARPIGVRREKTRPLTLDARVTLRLDPQFELPLAHWVLGVLNGAHKLKKRDQNFLSRLADAALSDLRRIFASDFGAEPAAPRAQGEALAFSLNIGSATNVAKLFIDRQAAIDARRRALAPAGASRVAVSRNSAIGPQRVKLGAKIGQARLGVGEMLSLNEGDVVVLDRDRQDWGEVCVAGVACRGLRSKLEHEDGALKMRLRLADNGEMK